MVSREESKQHVKHTFAHIFATCAWSLRPVGAQIVVSCCIFERFAEAKRQFWENKVRDPGLFEPFDNRNLQGPWNAYPRPSTTGLLVLEFDCWLPHIGLLILEFYYWPPSIGTRLLAA